MTRVKKGEPYWFVDIDGRAWDRYERNEVMDSVLFDTGNYFHTKEEAERMCKKFLAILKGADVIQIPSEEEIIIKASTAVKGNDLSFVDENTRFNVAYGLLKWFESKIVK